jgi:hypothetical protein
METSTTEHVLTPAEKRRRKIEYANARRQRGIFLYFDSEDQLEQMKLLAQKAGYRGLSPWLLQMVLNATGGSYYPPEYVQGLKNEGDRLRRWMESAREEAEDYKQQVKRLQSQRDSLLLLIHGLPNGADVVARFLQQTVGAQP